MSDRTDRLMNLREDFGLCRDYLRQVAIEVLDQGISNYPIFIASTQPVGLGRTIIDRDELDITWSFAASHLEDFVHRGLIDRSKVDDFRNTYKDPRRFACVFTILSETDINFVFIPYGEEGRRLQRPM